MYNKNNISHRKLKELMKMSGEIYSAFIKPASQLYLLEAYSQTLA